MQDQEELQQRIAARKRAMKNRQRMPVHARPQLAYIVMCCRCSDVEVVRSSRGDQKRLAPEEIDERMTSLGWIVTPAGYICKVCNEQAAQFQEHVQEEMKNHATRS